MRTCAYCQRHEYDPESSACAGCGANLGPSTDAEDRDYISFGFATSTLWKWPLQFHELSDTAIHLQGDEHS